jgi:CheY-like chemotaxis protein
MSRILLIDDDSTMAALIADILFNEDFVLAHVEDGIDGLRFLGINPSDELKRSSGELDWTFQGNDWAPPSAPPVMPDLILLDCMMPRLDGLSFAKELYNHSTAKFIPIIVMTSKNRMEEPFRELRNVVGFIVKPPNRQKLLEAVRNFGGGSVPSTGSINPARF